jgi:DNA replication and repair protein RecF
LQFDDFGVRLGDRDLRVFGSQGETRTAAISLILAQSEVVFQRRRARPVLFLDDIFSELDRDRARRLQERCARDHQIFIATARADDVAGWNPERSRQWLVEDGRLTTHP